VTDPSLLVVGEATGFQFGAVSVSWGLGLITADFIPLQDHYDHALSQERKWKRADFV